MLSHGSGALRAKLRPPAGENIFPQTFKFSLPGLLIYSIMAPEEKYSQFSTFNMEKSACGFIRKKPNGSVTSTSWRFKFPTAGTTKWARNGAGPANVPLFSRLYYINGGKAWAQSGDETLEFTEGHMALIPLWHPDPHGCVESFQHLYFHFNLTKAGGLDLFEFSQTDSHSAHGQAGDRPHDPALQQPQPGGRPDLDQLSAPGHQHLYFAGRFHRGHDLCLQRNHGEGRAADSGAAFRPSRR